MAWEYATTVLVLASCCRTLYIRSSPRTLYTVCPFLGHASDPAVIVLVHMKCLSHGYSLAIDSKCIIYSTFPLERAFLVKCNFFPNLPLCDLSPHTQHLFPLFSPAQAPCATRPGFRELLLLPVSPFLLKKPFPNTSHQGMLALLHLSPEF